MPRRRPVAIALGVLLGAVLVRANGQAPAPPSGTGLLVGRVVDSATNRPVSGAVVTLGGTATVSSSNVIFNFSQAALPGGNRSVLTTAQGHFVFADLPAGTYSLQATKPGYSPGGYGKRTATGPPQLITIADAERVGDLTIPLFKHASITGTVTDEAGEPVIGITLRSVRRIWESGRSQFAVASAGMTAETDDRGRFRFTTLIPGEYMLIVAGSQRAVPLAAIEAAQRAEDTAAATEIQSVLTGNPFDLGVRMAGVVVGDHLFVPASRGLTPPPPTADGKVFVYPTHFYPGTSNESDATLIQLRAGDERRIDVQLKPTAASRVSGTVTGPSGPVPNLALMLTPAVTSLLSSTFFETATAVTDPAGGFVFLGVPPGQYSLTALRLPARTGGGTPYTTVVQTGGGGTTFIGGGGSGPPAIPDGPTLWADMTLGVGNTDLTGVNVTLQGGFRVNGRVEFDGAAPRPTAVRGLGVRFEPVHGRLGSITATRASLDATGKLSTYELAPTRYLVVVSGNLAGWTFDGAMINGIDAADEPFDLRDGNAELVLRFIDRPSTLAGMVRLANGQPDAGAQVLVFPAAAALAGFQGAARRTRVARVSRSGEYRVNGLPAGEYLAVAVAADAAENFPSVTLLRSLSAQASRVRMAERQDHVLHLTTARAR
jgi:hypothetical protein